MKIKRKERKKEKGTVPPFKPIKSYQDTFHKHTKISESGPGSTDQIHCQLSNTLLNPPFSTTPSFFLPYRRRTSILIKYPQQVSTTSILQKYPHQVSSTSVFNRTCGGRMPQDEWPASRARSPPRVIIVIFPICVPFTRCELRGAKEASRLDVLFSGVLCKFFFFRFINVISDFIYIFSLPFCLFLSFLLLFHSVFLCFCLSPSVS